MGRGYLLPCVGVAARIIKNNSVINLRICLENITECEGGYVWWKYHYANDITTTFRVNIKTVKE